MEHSRIDNRLILFHGLVWAFSTSLLWIIAALSEAALLSLPAMGLFFYACFIAFRISKSAGVVLLPFILVRAAVIVSLIAIEFGAAIPELSRVGEAGGYTASYAFYSGIMFISCAMIMCAFERRFSRPNQIGAGLLPGSRALLSALCIVGICSVLAIYLAAFGLQTGFPLLTGTDRFVYRRFSADFFVLNALNMKFISAILLGWVCFVNQNIFMKAGALISFAVLTVLYFLFGDKFFTMLTNIAFFFTPYLLLKWDGRFMRLAKYMPLAAAAIILSFGASYYIYSNGFAYDVDVTIQRIVDRMSGQGELWFVAARYEGQAFTWASDLIAKSFSVLVEEQPDYETFLSGLGTFYFTYNYSDPAMIASVQRNAGTTSPTMGFEAWGLVLTGYVGLFAMMIVAAIGISMSGGYVINALRRGNWISITAATVIIVQFWYATNQGSLTPIFLQSRFKWYVAVIVMELLFLLIVVPWARQTAASVQRMRDLARTVRSRKLARPDHDSSTIS
jgi:hypothetical protein